MASDEGRKVTLKSSDGKEFLVEETVAMESQMIRQMIEDGCADSGIPLPNVSSKILSKAIEYCKKHVAAKPSVAAGSDEKSAEEDLKAWDSDFMKANQATLYHLMLAANYLNIKGLLDLTSQTMEDMFKGESPEVMCKPYSIMQNFNLTPEELSELEEEIRRARIRRANRIQRGNRRAFDEEIRRENRRAFDEISWRERLVLGFMFLYLFFIVIVLLIFCLAISGAL